jgi:hypothetical protein
MSQITGSARRFRNPQFEIHNSILPVTNQRSEPSNPKSSYDLEESGQIRNSQARNPKFPYALPLTPCVLPLPPCS